jgi:hypothetical protein
MRRLTLKTNISHATTLEYGSTGDHSSHIPRSILHVHKDPSEIICPQAFFKFQTNSLNLVKTRILMDNNKQQSSHTDTER